MKKILYVEGCRDGSVGGSHTCLYTMVTNLDRNRFCPTVIFYDANVIEKKLRSQGVETRIIKYSHPVNFRQLLKGLIPFLKWIFIILLPAQKIINFCLFFIRPAIKYAIFIKKNQFDIVHLNNGIITNHDWMLAALISGVKIISHERGINLKLSRTERYFGNKMDMLICVSKAIAIPLLSNGVRETKIRIIYDGIDSKQIKIKRNPEEIKKLYEIKDKSFVIGVVGNLKEWKGQEIVIRAVGILQRDWPDIKCFLVGGAVEDDPYKNKLERLIGELKIRKNIIFTGFQDNPIDYFNAMDIVVHSSIKPEPFGMVNLEAMWLGKPVVATKEGGPLEIFADGVEGFLIEPGKPDELAEKLMLLINNAQLRDKMGQRAYKKVIKKFVISKTVQKVQEIYDEISPKT